MIVGVDVGTRSLKAVVTDRNLGLLGEASEPYEPSFPRPGHAEQDPRLWEAALGPAISRALAAADRSPADIAALGISGQLDGCVAVGADGRPLSPCLIWMDRRAEGLLAGLPRDKIRTMTGLVPDACHMAAKMMWLKREAAAVKAAVRFHQPVSYLVSRLTGESVFDHGVASTTMVYSIADRRLDPDLLDLFGLAAVDFPALAEASDRVGRLHGEGARLTGLAAGTPVAVGTGDDFANLLGAGLVAPGVMACAVGTGEVVGALHPSPVIDELGLVETHCYPGARYFIENPGWLSGGALGWLADTARVPDFGELDRLAAQVAPGSDGLVFLPALNGAMAPEWIASARGAFYGLTPAHGRGHMARAVLEGCAYAMRDVLTRLEEMGVAVGSIRLLGGGARSRLWAQIRADVSGLAVEVPEVVDTSPLGAAALAAVAAGFFADVDAACARLGRIEAVVEAESRNQDAYDAAYASYRRLFACLRPIFMAAAQGSGATLPPKPSDMHQSGGHP